MLSALARGGRTGAELAALVGYARAEVPRQAPGGGPDGRSPLVDELADICYNRISKNGGGGRHECGKPASRVRETSRIC